MAKQLLKDALIPPENLRLLIASAMEFRSAHTAVSLAVEAADSGQSGRIQLDIEIAIDKKDEIQESFSFESTVNRGTMLPLGSELESKYVSVPCGLLLSGADELELTDSVEIEANQITLNARSLILRNSNRLNDIGGSVSIIGSAVESTLEQVEDNGVEFFLAVDNPKVVQYPLVNYVSERRPLPSDSELGQKYFRLKRILMEFRSHSKGALAKYKPKIEHERVLKNEIGRRVLNRLVRDGVLYLKGSFYYVNPEAQSKYFGTTWQDLRKGQSPETLLAYLRTI